MNKTLVTFLFEAANFLVLAAALAWLLFKPVRRALAAQRKAMADEAEAAKTAREEAERLRADLKKQLASIEAQADARRKESAKEAEARAQVIIADAKKEASRIIDEHRADQAARQKQQADQLALATAHAAGTVVSRLLESIGGPALQEALLASACHQLKELDGSIQGAVHVESAGELEAQARDRITQALGRVEHIEFRVDPTLMVGVRVSSNRGLVDASIKGLTAFAQHALADQIKRMNGNATEAGDD